MHDLLALIADILSDWPVTRNERTEKRSAKHKKKRADLPYRPLYTITSSESSEKDSCQQNRQDLN